jgi:hypothetical protein
VVALGWVEGQFAEEFAGGGVDDADVAVLDEDDDVGSGVGPADADGVEPALIPEGDLAGLVDPVVADAVVGVVVAVAGGGLRPGGVDRGGGGPMRQGPVRVRSDRDAVLAFRPARFLGPPPEPGVPLSGHRALRMSRWVLAAHGCRPG